MGLVRVTCASSGFIMKLCCGEMEHQGERLTMMCLEMLVVMNVCENKHLSCRCVFAGVR